MSISADLHHHIANDAKFSTVWHASHCTWALETQYTRSIEWQWLLLQHYDSSSLSLLMHPTLDFPRDCTAENMCSRLLPLVLFLPRTPHSEHNDLNAWRRRNLHIVLTWMLAQHPPKMLIVKLLSCKLQDKSLRLKDFIAMLRKHNSGTHKDASGSTIST